MSNIKPVYVMFESSPIFKDYQISAIFSGINDILEIADIQQYIKIYNLGLKWREESWKSNRNLTPYKSIDWYLQRGQKASLRVGQINCDQILRDIQFEPRQKTQPHYDVIILCSDIYPGNEQINFVVGLAVKGFGTVISINRFLDVPRIDELGIKLQAECIKTEIMHELGHVLGLIPKTREYNIKESLGKHCDSNRCIMRQGLIVPKDWIKMTQNRLKFGPFCKECVQDLRKFFLN